MWGVERAPNVTCRGNACTGRYVQVQFSFRRFIYTDWVQRRESRAPYRRPAGKPIFGSLISLATVLFTSIAGAAPPPFAGADTFIQKNCASCHNSTSPAARLDLSKFSYEPANPDNFATW